MKKVGKGICLLAVLVLFTGCGEEGVPGSDAGASLERESGATKDYGTASGDAVPSGSASAEVSETTGNSEQESSEQASPQEKKESVQAAYEAFLEGDISLFDSAQVDMWALEAWKDTILPQGELEYTYLDLDGDGSPELLVQWIDDPCSFNGVFHYDNGALFCWQFDCVEMSSRDYPLKDGAMVSQYDYNGASSYTIFRYQSDGGREEISTLFVREELVGSEDENPCPYYEVDGNEVDKDTFDRKLREEILGQIPERGAWTAKP